MIIGTKHKAVAIALAALVLIVVLISADRLGIRTSSTAQASMDNLPGLAVEELPICRFGVITLDPLHVNWLDELQAGWHMNFTYNAVEASNDAEFVPLIWLKQNKDGQGNYLPSYYIFPALKENSLGTLIAQHPGTLWVIGNEVDRGPTAGSSGQGDMYPDIYAKAYHDAYHFIKDRDPSAQVAISGLVQVTPGRLQYLDMVWDSYIAQFGQPMPVDVWNMHLYIMPESLSDGVTPSDMAGVAVGTDIGLAKWQSYDPAGPDGPASTCADDRVYCFAEHDNTNIFKEQVKAMRQWMADHGQRSKPLILTEFSILYPYVIDGPTCWLQDEFGNCFTDSRVIQFLNYTFDFLENATDADIGNPHDGNKLIQQSLWFSISNHLRTGYRSDLVTPDLSQLTPIGNAYLAYVQTVTREINFLISRVNAPYAQADGGKADVTLKAFITNNGSITNDEPFEVTFYADENLTQEIGKVIVPDPGYQGPEFPLPGCARREIVASVVWPDLPVGEHKFWVKVNTGTPPAPESDGTDNLGSGTATVTVNLMNLPLIIRR